MKITSKFRDYYDIAQSFGYDDHVHYIRTKREVELETWPFFLPGRVDFRNFVASNYAIGFCGKVYPIIELGKYNDRAPTTVRLCYTIEDVDNFFKETLDQRQWQTYISADKDSFRKLNMYVNRNGLLEFFSKYDNLNPKDCEKYFLGYNAPIFTCRQVSLPHDYNTKAVLTLNDILRPYEFFRVFDPYVTFQELSMYLSNIAEPRKPIPAIDDVTMAEIKGFNKYSFRKDATKKRKK